MLDVAYVKCTQTGGDPDYDGGCALATAYSQGYAQACAEAVAESISGISFSGAKCTCDTSVAAFANATAHEIETIFAFMEQQVEARTCNVDNHGTDGWAHIYRNCWAESVADLTASVRIPPKCNGAHISPASVP